MTVEPDGVRFPVDEDFDNDIIRGLLRRLPKLDIVRVQDLGMSGAKDAVVLERAARENRVLLTHDVSTMKSHAYARVASGQSMPGVFAISQAMAVGAAIEELVLIAECSLDREWEGQVRHLPL